MEVKHTVTSQVRPMRQSASFKKVNGHVAAAKQKKLNIYVPRLPKSSSVHETYSFISQKQGFMAYGSHVTVKPSSSQIVEGTDSESLIANSDIDCHLSDDFTGADVEAEVLETENGHKRKRTAGVGR